MVCQSYGLTEVAHTRTRTSFSAGAGLAMLALAFVGPPVNGTQAPPPVAATASPSPAAAPERLLFVALYERGPAWTAGKGVFEQAGIEAHMQHLRANADKLLGAGRFGHATDAAATDRAVGLVIVAASSQSEAEALFAADPAVSSGLMKATVRRWEARRLKAY
jgi:uncharacterized protein YciI